MAPPAPWSPTAHAFAQHQFSHVVNFWKQGRPASFRLEALPSGRAELNLTFQLPPASEVVPPPSPVIPVPAQQRPIRPLFPGGFSSQGPASGRKAKPAPHEKVSSKQRKSLRRSVLHRAALAVPSLPPPKDGSLRHAALVCVQQLQGASALPGNTKDTNKRPFPDSPNAPSPSQLPPLAQRIRKDIHILESEESPEKLRSPPRPVNSPSPISPCLKGLPSPAPLVFTPVPTRESSCLNCEAEMTLDHQCEELISSSVTSVNCGSKPPVTDLSKSLGACSESELSYDGQGKVLPAKTDLPRRTPGRILNLKKFCETCDVLVPISHKCIT